jgi:hypothetical protein
MKRAYTSTVTFLLKAYTVTSSNHSRSQLETSSKVLVSISSILVLKAGAKRKIAYYFVLELSKVLQVFLPSIHETAETGLPMVDRTALGVGARQMIMDTTILTATPRTFNMSYPDHWPTSWRR